MLGTLAITVDVLHATLMVVWFVGLPLLIWHRWPRLSRAYAMYALVFVVVSQLSYWILGECFLTTLARALWERQPSGAMPRDAGEWFTVRCARAVFHAAPSHRVIAWISEALVTITAIGSLLVLRRGRRRAPAPFATVRGRSSWRSRRAEVAGR